MDKDSAVTHLKLFRDSITTDVLIIAGGLVKPFYPQEYPCHTPCSAEASTLIDAPATDHKRM